MLMVLLMIEAPRQSGLPMMDEFARPPDRASVLGGYYSPAANCPLGRPTGQLHVLSARMMMVALRAVHGTSGAYGPGPSVVLVHQSQMGSMRLVLVRVV